MAWTTARRTALVLFAVACAATSATTATAATTLEPSPAEARTFATTSGGWTSSVDYGGLVCIPGVTCPSATPSYRTTGGVGGASDGHLRNTFGTLLGVLATTTISWTSPSFVAPSGTDTATLRFKVRPQIASLLAIGGVTITPSIVDVDDGTRTTALAPLPQTAASASFGQASVTVPTTAVVPGRNYRVRLATAVTTAVSAVTSGNVDIDDVELELSDLGPDDAVPTVTGATNAPTRTATFTRGADVTSAVVELLDGEGELLTSYPDADDDGTETITLPADGNYGVRVVRTDGTGQSSTSAIVPVTLDRVGPDVTNLGITVTPTVSSTRTRTVAFTRPADAVTTVAQVLNADGDPVGLPVTVTGGSGAVTLGPGDGSFRVRLTLTDAAGNATTATSDPVTFDTTAPDAGPAPTVTGDGNSRARTASFTRDAGAATVVVEVLDGDGDVIDAVPVPSGGSTAITLPDADGSYGVRVRQTDAAGNGATTPTTTVTLDRSAPDVSALELAVTPAVSNDRDRTVTIVRPADAATVTAQVIDGSDDPVGSPVTIAGTSGTIALCSTDGTYRVVVTVADETGNRADATSDPVTLDSGAAATTPRTSRTAWPTGSSCSTARRPPTSAMPSGRSTA